jgi:ATP-binding cassette subfamily B multidrug efflux pump
MKLILKYLKNYKLLLFLNLIGVLSFALVELGIPTVVSTMIDNGIVTGNIPYIKQMGGVIFLISVLGGAGAVLLAYCSSKISTGVTRDIRNDIFIKSQTFSHTEYNKFGVSSMITRTTNDVFQLQQFVNILLRTALLAPVMLIVSFSLTFRTSPALSLVVACTIPAIVAGVVIVARISNPLSENQQKNLDRLNRISRENLTGIRVIRAFCNDAHESERFGEANARFTSFSKKLFKLMATTQPAFFLLLNIAILFVVWISSNKINAGTLQVGQLVAFLEYQFHAMFSMMLFSLVFIMYPRAQVSANRVIELITQTPLIQNPKNGVKETKQTGTLCFDHVSFRYSDGEEAILEDISFTANAGDTVAFIGSTGSGKSTLIGLIPRFYDVTEGRILLDGVDVRDYDLGTLRQKIGYIPQKALLFSGSIREAIQFGKKDASPEEIEHAAKVAQAYDFITEKPMQFDEPITEGASNLSGGQKQRLSITRAVVRKPEVYVFDDSFSALDFKTDAALRRQLKKETKGSIVLIVAQRVSTIMDAEKIVVLDEGRIVGIGTHKELLDTCNIYYEIASSQLSKEELVQ